MRHSPLSGHGRGESMRQPGALARYGSAPGSLLASIADSVVGGGGGGGYASGAVGSEVAMVSRFFPGESSCLTAESSCKASAVASPDPKLYCKGGGGANAVGAGLQRSHGLGEIPVVELAAAAAAGSEKVTGGASHPLMRHSSSPAGFFSNLMVDNGFSVTRGIANYSQAGSDGICAMTSRRLKSQLSFSRKDPLSQISEISIPDIGESICGGKNLDEVAGQSYISSNFPVVSWDDTNSIVFSPPPSKRAKDNNGDTITNFSNLESQFSLPTTSLEMATVEKFIQIHQDSVPFKIRAKRGCATHPRSIAERERRTRISEKLRKLEELVPNMEKQTNTADMLDLAIQHIKSLQTQVQRLKEEQANCTCAAS